MKYADISFTILNNRFQHSLGADLGYFALWKNARPFLPKIREYLEQHFEVLLETEVQWSEEHFEENAARLYEIPIYKDGESFSIATSHTKKIGDREFVVFVVKDLKPDYNYTPSVSGKIELSNLSIVKAKYLFRDWIESETGSKYAIHSTNNIYEFCFQAPLLFGAEIFDALTKGTAVQIPRFEKDLEGAGGWESYTALFEVLQRTSNYCILRNFESLPAGNQDKDLDILTDHYQRFASIVGALQSQHKPYKGNISVAGIQVPLDIRFVGDGYYCSKWQYEMLQTKETQDTVYVPSTDHYFFSLLYHAIVQKPTVKDAYVSRLLELAKQLNFDWFTADIVISEAANAKVLNGYLAANNYFYESPVDQAVYCNARVIAKLPRREDMVAKRSNKEKLKSELLKVFPESWYHLYLKVRTGS